MKGLFQHRADVLQGRTAVRPSLVWIWPCSSNARDACCASFKNMIWLEGWCIVYNEDVHSVTRTLFPVHQLLQLEEWRCDSETNIFVMWQCLAGCYQKLLQDIKYLSLVMLSLPFSCFEVMVDRHCPSPRNPFEFESKSVEWVLSLPRKDIKRPHIYMEGFVNFPQGGCDQFLSRLVPNGDVVRNFTGRWSALCTQVCG